MLRLGMTKIEKLPFTFTPSIIRYLEEIISKYEKRSQGILNHQSVLPFSITFETYKEDEPFQSHSEDMRKNFVDYLVERDVVKFNFIPGIDDRRFDENIITETGSEEEYYAKGTAYFETNFGFTILEMSTIKKIWTYYTQHQNPSILKGTEAFDLRVGQYDKDTGKLKFNKRNHSFNKLLRPLFKELWNRRSHICGKKETGSSTIISVGDLAKIPNIEKDTIRLKAQLHNIQTRLSAKFSKFIILEAKDDYTYLLIKVKEV